MELERAGIPAILIVTTPFRVMAQTMARTKGLPELRMIELDHPIGGIDPADLEETFASAIRGAVDLIGGS